MKRNLLLVLVLFVVKSSFATISWMGNHSTGAQPIDSQTIHFYIEMFDSYGGCHAEVRINEGGTWVNYAMTQGANNGNNSTWTADINVKSNSTSYLFHGWDDYGANVYDNNGTSNYSISIQPTTKSGGNGMWNTADNWCDGSVPSNSAASYQIAHNLTLDTNVTVAKLTINSGVTFTASDANTRTLTINAAASGTTLVNNGTWHEVNNITVFTGAPSSGDIIHTTSGDIQFKDVKIYKTGGTNNVGVSFASPAKIKGTLEIGSGGFVATAPPSGFYDPLAVLRFNQGSGAVYDVNAFDYSWSSSVIPQFITISSGTVNLNSARTALGNLLIEGGALVLNADLTIQGNWTRTSGTFTPNFQTVTLSGTTNGIISTLAGATLYDLVVDKTSGATVTLASDMSISHNMTVTAGAFNVNPAVALTVTGTLTNNAGNSGLVLKSNASGTGSLKHNTTGVSGTAERYIAGDWLSPNSGWHQIGSPVAAQALSAFETTGAGNGYDLYGWDEPTNMWVNYKDAGFATWNGSSNFNAGQGYMISYEANQTKSFAGILNASDITLSNLSNAGNYWYTGWHLISNPFSCALSWNDGNWALNNVYGTAKVWDGTAKSYSDLAANGTIPSAQGFMVKVSSSTNSLTLPVAARLHSTTPWYKSTTSNDRFLLVASEADGNSSQQSQIMVNAMASQGFDIEFDSYFLAGYAPQFYALLGDEQLSTNTLPAINPQEEIPFGFVKNDAGSFTIELRETIPGYKVYLVDLLTGSEQNLTSNPLYAFTSQVGDDPNRFILRFGTLGVPHTDANSNVNVYTFARNIVISGAVEGSDITITSLTGQMLMQTHAGNESLVTLDSGRLAGGIYLVSVVSGKNRISKKVVVR